jgi:Domain of unknown function (DUF397)
VKSSHSNPNGACVQAEKLPDGTVVVWDDKDPDRTEQRYTRQEWEAFVLGVQDGQFGYDGLPVRPAARGRSR